MKLQTVILNQTLYPRYADEGMDMALAKMYRIAHAVCGCCAYYSKKAKKSGICGLRPQEVFNTKRAVYEDRYPVVYAYHHCDEFKKKD